MSDLGDILENTLKNALRNAIDPNHIERRQRYQSHENRYTQSEINDVVNRVQNMSDDELKRAVRDCNRWYNGSFNGQIIDRNYRHISTPQVNYYACQEVGAEIDYRGI